MMLQGNLKKNGLLLAVSLALLLASGCAPARGVLYEFDPTNPLAITEKGPKKGFVPLYMVETNKPGAFKANPAGELEIDSRKPSIYDEYFASLFRDTTSKIGTSATM